MRKAMGIAVLSMIASVITTGAADQTAFAGIFQHYEAIRQALIEDSTVRIAEHASAIQKIAEELKADFSAEAAGVKANDGAKVQELLPEISDRAGKVAAAKDLKSVRSELGELTKPLARHHALIQGNRPVLAYCPMVKMSWLQPDEPIGNPYAPHMLRCGEVVAK